MGGIDLDEVWEQLKEQQTRRARLGADVQALRADYPGFMFTIIARPGPGETAIEAVPKPGYEGDLVALIKPDAEGIREVLDAALDDP